MNERREIVIIGAGPAGSVAAALLARAGCSVTLIEQHRFPRDKVCGECLSAVGMDVLKRIGLADLIRQAGAVQLTKFVLHSPAGGVLQVSLPRMMWGISRNRLDHELLNSAMRSGVRVLQPVRCEQVIPGEAASVVVRDLASNSIARLSADAVVIADGKAALPPPRPAFSGDLGIKAHFTQVKSPRDAIELFGVCDHYGGLAPVENNRWNASFSIPADRMQLHGGNIDEMFASIVRENRTLSSRMKSARRDSEWMASALPRYGIDNDWPTNIILIGNAAAAIEPIGGEGMGLAMRSAELAATAIIAAVRLNRPIDIISLQSEYRKLWRVRRFICRAAALAISSPRLSNWIIPHIAAADPPTAIAMRLLGKAESTQNI